MDDWSIERVTDRMRIQAVLYGYCRAIDRIDLAALAEVFHDDAVIDIGNYRGTPDGFIAAVGARHPGVPRAAHMVTNVLIDFLGNDRAYCESWCLALEEQPRRGGDVDRTFRVRYGDIFERRGGSWRVAERMTVFDHAALAPVDPARDVDLGDRIWGRRGTDDPIAAQRAALGL